MPHEEQPRGRERRGDDAITHRLDREQFRELLCFLRDYLTTLARIEQKVNVIMARTQEWTQLLTDFNEATNAVAVRLQALEDKVAAGGMSAAEEAETHAEFQAVVATLKNMGANPNQPVPPPVEPTPTP